MAWVKIIYTRAQAVLPPEQKSIVKYSSPASSYIELKNEMDIAITRPSVIDQYVVSANPPTDMPDRTPGASPDAAPAEKLYLKMFWLLVCLEVVCSSFYILAGVSVLRLYPGARLMVFLTLYLDILLKGMVITYMKHWAIPLESGLKGTNILVSYFSPGVSWQSSLSAYLTGIKLDQPQGALFLFVYLVYLFVCFYFFTRPAIKQQFTRS